MKKPPYSDHLVQYAWAGRHIFNEEVIDLGCGEGYGLQILSTFAKSVHGIDNAKVYLQRAAKKQYHCPSSFETKDLNEDRESLKHVKGTFVAFEVLEHIKSPGEFLKHLYPNKVIFSVPHKSPHKLHLTEYHSWEDVFSLIPSDTWKVETYTAKDGSIQLWNPWLPLFNVENPDRYIVILEP